MPKRTLLFLVSAVSLGQATASAQTVLVTTLDDATSTPVFGALVYLTSPDGATVRNALTDERGRALFVGVPAGEYRIRAEMIGMSTARTEAFSVADGRTVARELRLASSAIELEDLSVEAEGDRCRLRSEQGLLVAQLWDEARKALTAAVFTDREQVYRYRTMLYERDLARRNRSVEREEQRLSGGYLRTPFESRPAEDLVENGFVRPSRDGDLYFAPDASVLLSNAFLDTHCFRISQESGEAGAVGLAFEPVEGRRRIPDIAGTLWLDRSTAELRRLDFTYRNLDPAITTPEVGGRVVFQRLPNGTWFIPEWRIRMPRVATQRDFRGQQQLLLDGYREVGGIVQQVQEAGGRTLLEAETATIEGVVLDSLGAEPVGGVRVGVVSSSQRVFTDAEGRFRITGLTDGVYRVAYTHPSLEEVGFRPEPVATEVHSGEVASLRLVLPSVGSMLVQSCGGDDASEGDGVVAGSVRRARTGQPVPGAIVRVQWFTFRPPVPGTPVPIGADVEGFEATADQDGYYRVCGLPEDERLTLTAIHGEATSPVDTIRIGELERGVVVRDLEIPVRR